ncbi:hypothetical protein [Paracoccus litorisediminis]|uniref:Uncharacterized protein n=1 Tax=Paracoccus litorisediminis TaxID=2006130 RepID=A0A844HLM1_9RHOB|nr:hypothetical protein [Paracoccus litorisediminis]MTH61173.1 hypothetical protein [Paracoccus litorisediminis]
MKITSAVIDQLLPRLNVDMIDLPSDDMDFSERFQAVVGQDVLLSIGLHTNATSAVWQFEIAELSGHWHAESEMKLPARDYKFFAGFTSFENAMAALCETTRYLSSLDGFSEV